MPAHLEPEETGEDREPDLVEVIRGGRDIPVMDHRIADHRLDLDWPVRIRKRRKPWVFNTRPKGRT